MRRQLNLVGRDCPRPSIVAARDTNESEARRSHQTKPDSIAREKKRNVQPRGLLRNRMRHPRKDRGCGRNTIRKREKIPPTETARMPRRGDTVSNRPILPASGRRQPTRPTRPARRRGRTAGSRGKPAMRSRRRLATERVRMRSCRRRSSRLPLSASSRRPLTSLVAASSTRARDALFEDWCSSPLVTRLHE